jgi:hypothetical protein
MDLEDRFLVSPRPKPLFFWTGSGGGDGLREIFMGGGGASEWELLEISFKLLLS